MKTNLIKLFAVAVIALPLLAVVIFNAPSTVVVANVNHSVTPSSAQQDDIAAQYKKTCAVCHKANAEKFFEPSKMDEVLVEIVLKGKKAEKPPHMPSYEDKGVDKDKAKLYVAYMRQMRTPPKE